MIETAILKDTVVPNLEGGTDLYIKSSLLNFNILSVFLESINRSNPKINKIFGKKYYVIIHEGLIYSGTINKKSLLPKPVPFGFVLKNSASIIVKNVDLSDDDVLMLTVKYDYDFKFNSNNTFVKIDWPFGPDNTFLIFSQGLAGLSNSLCKKNNDYFKKYGKELSSEVYHIDHLIGNKLNSDYTNYLEEYFLGNILLDLVDNSYQIIMETYIQHFFAKDGVVFGRIYSPGDSLSHVEVITKDVINAQLVHINDIYNSKETVVKLENLKDHLLVQGSVYFKCKAQCEKVSLKITRSVFNLNTRGYSKDLLKKDIIFLPENDICKSYTLE